MALNTGDVLNNRYRIVKLLAQGGFGTLYRAWDTSLGRPCVVKENLAAAPDAQRQFLREAKILANLSHPNLPRVTDYFLAQGSRQYLVMDYVEGQDLQKMLEDRGGPFPEDRVLLWAGQICDALGYLHSQNPPVIHRDVKPANIQLTPSGQAVLVDFGIAKVYDPSLKTTLGAQAVSPGYSPYEQYGKGKTDARSDIYALGATLYTLLTGQEPPESIQRVVSDPLISPRQVNRNLTMRTSAALMRAMQIDATQRFQSAADFKSALTPPPPVQVSLPPVTAYQAPIQMSPGGPARRALPWGWIGVVGALLIIIVVLLSRNANGKADVPHITPSQAQATQAGAASNPLTSAVTTSPSGASTPVSAEPPQPTLTPLVYTVQAGDTCSEVAEAYGVSIHDIVGQNPDLEPDCGVLYAGLPILIPQVNGPIQTPSSIRSPTASTPSVTQVSQKDGMRLVFIPGGEFTMGAGDDDPDAGEFERPVHIVYLSAYWIDQTEVTNEKYERCVEAGVCQPPGSLSSKTHPVYFNETAYQDYPVIYVNWDEANTYCRWAGRRLPTEAEWEKAARGTDGGAYPWGSGPPSMRLANFGSFFGDVNRVGSYPAGASPYGVLDMAGNVAEWVADWYGASYYATSLYKNPTGPETGDFKLIRGGSWFNQILSLRVTFRLWNYPDLQSETIGFRCAK